MNNLIYFYLFNIILYFNIIISINIDNNIPLPLFQYNIITRKPLKIKNKRYLKLSSLLDSSTLLGNEITPLYIGYGTHISYIYVGNPPQRQSVIIDTGSSATAFPCTVRLYSLSSYLF